jgi:hypothetical protein
MPATSAKNMPLSPAATDLGLGTMLTEQVQDETEEARRRRLLQQQAQQSVSPAVLSLFGGVGA